MSLRNRTVIRRLPRTSIESYKKCLQTDIFANEEKKILEALRLFGACSSRDLSLRLEIERTNVTRAIYNLMKKDRPMIRVGYIKQCPVTGRRVNYYTTIN